MPLKKNMKEKQSNSPGGGGGSEWSVRLCRQEMRSSVLAESRKATQYWRTEPAPTSFPCQGTPLQTFPSQQRVLLWEGGRTSRLLHGSPDLWSVGSLRAGSLPAATGLCTGLGTSGAPNKLCWMELWRIWLLLSARHDAFTSLLQFLNCKMGTVKAPPLQDCPKDYIWYVYKAYSTLAPSGCSIAYGWLLRLILASNEDMSLSTIITQTILPSLLILQMRNWGPERDRGLFKDTQCLARREREHQVYLPPPGIMIVSTDVLPWHKRRS